MISPPKTAIVYNKQKQTSEAKQPSFSTSPRKTHLSTYKVIYSLRFSLILYKIFLFENKWVGGGGRGVGSIKSKMGTEEANSTLKQGSAPRDPV